MVGWHTPKKRLIKGAFINHHQGWVTEKWGWVVESTRYQRGGVVKSFAFQGGGVIKSYDVNRIHIPSDRDLILFSRG